jgi:hypothetical protein
MSNVSGRGKLTIVPVAHASGDWLVKNSETAIKSRREAR